MAQPIKEKGYTIPGLLTMADTTDLPTIDVVVPMSHMWLMPYLKNCVRSVRWQDYPQFLVDVILCVMYSENEDMSELAEFCRSSEITVVFRRLKDPAFNISRAKNVAARHGSSKCVAFIDADVVLHPMTFRLAAPFLLKGLSVVIPVGRMGQGPTSDIFEPESIPMWEDLTKNAPFRRDGVGNVVLPRSTLESLRGYDERFHGWGGPDTDLEKRHGIIGKPMVNLKDNGCKLAMHQHHKITPTRESHFTQRNRVVLASSHDAVRNPGVWGDIAG